MPTDAEVDVTPAPPDAAVVRKLLESRARFVAFVARRTGNPADAEEIVQAAFEKSLAASSALRDDESAVAWFYRVLRNAIVDHGRRRARERRAFAEQAVDPTSPGALDAELEREICGCVRPLVDTLEPSYAALLTRVDLEGRAIHEVAVEAGISAGNARVRLLRARRALRKQVERVCGACATHGCMDCHCAKGAC